MEYKFQRFPILSLEDTNETRAHKNINAFFDETNGIKSIRDVANGFFSSLFQMTNDDVKSEAFFFIMIFTRPRLFQDMYTV